MLKLGGLLEKLALSPGSVQAGVAKATGSLEKALAKHHNLPLVDVQRRIATRVSGMKPAFRARLRRGSIDAQAQPDSVFDFLASRYKTNAVKGANPGYRYRGWKKAPGAEHTTWVRE